MKDTSHIVIDSASVLRTFVRLGLIVLIVFIVHQLISWVMAEAEAGHALWSGLTGNPKKSLRPGWGARGGMKDGSSTDVVVHAGEIVSTHYITAITTLGHVGSINAPCRARILLWFSLDSFCDHITHGLRKCAVPQQKTPPSWELSPSNPSPLF